MNRRRFSPKYRPAEAAELLAMLVDWFTFDNTPFSAVSSREFIQTYGGSITYEPGLKNEQIVSTLALRAPSGLSDDANWSMGGWLDMSSSCSFDTGIGVGVSTTLDTAYHAAFFLTPTATGTGGFFIRSAGSGGTENGSYAVIPGTSRLHVAMIWDEAALTFSGYLNGVFFQSVTLASSPPAGSVGVLFQTGYGAAAFADLKRHMDEVSTYSGKLTAAQITYLYSNGLGKSYADVVADAA